VQLRGSPGARSGCGVSLLPAHAAVSSVTACANFVGVHRQELENTRKTVSFSHDKAVRPLR
jgi:hypothetical protein